MNPNDTAEAPEDLSREPISCPGCGQEFVLDFSNGLAKDLVCPICGAEFSAAPVDLLEFVPAEFRELEPDPATVAAEAAAAAAVEEAKAEARARRQRVALHLTSSSQLPKTLSYPVLALGIVAALALIGSGVATAVALRGSALAATSAILEGLGSGLAALALGLGLGGLLLKKR